jgi:single-strand DNA-binding protein
MSRSLNKVMIIGYLGREPEMRYTSSGKAVTTFSVATNRIWSSASGERREETEWFTVVAWGSLAEICKQHLTKGTQVYVEGRLQTRRWEDAEGKKHAAVEVVANEMIQVGEKKDSPGAAEGRAAPTEEEYPF